MLSSNILAKYSLVPFIMHALCNDLNFVSIKLGTEIIVIYSCRIFNELYIMCWSLIKNSV